MKTTDHYTATYDPSTIGGEQGYWYCCYVNGRIIFEGWERGAKKNAEATVREGINAREALRAAAGLA